MTDLEKLQYQEALIGYAKEAFGSLLASPTMVANPETIANQAFNYAIYMVEKELEIRDRIRKCK